MCGISGIISNNLCADDLKTLVKATKKMKHRGPDGEGYLWFNFDENNAHPMASDDTPAQLTYQNWINYSETIRGRGVLFGHRRLSIIDVSAAGHQPMSDNEQKVWVTYNGEIYNYIELKKTLSADYHFKTDSDTEVLIASWIKWGPDCLKYFVGMFAFAILDFRDPNNPLIFMARDPFGIKPLYYARFNEGVYFASEIKTLLEMGVSRKGNHNRAIKYLVDNQTDEGEETFFTGISQLAAGHFLILRGSDNKTCQVNQYWKPRLNVLGEIKQEEAHHLVRDAFLKNLKLHLRSDVRVGAALSGGIDSSGIVCGIRALDVNLNINTFSYVAENKKISEKKWVDIVTQHIKAQTNFCAPDSGDLLSHLDKLISVQDEPFGSTSIFAQYCVFKLAADNDVKVMLDGQGADEMFAGYSQYPAKRVESMLANNEWRNSIHFIRNANYAVGGNGLKLALKAIRNILPPRAVNGINRLTNKKYSIRALRDGWQNYTRSDYSEKRETSERLKTELIRSITENSLPALLRYEDRNSMAHSVESRVPFLTTELVDLVLSLKEELFINEEGTSKFILRKAINDFVPDEIAWRRDKIGFATPEQDWFMENKDWLGQKFLTIKDTLPMLNHAEIDTQWKNLLKAKQHFDFRFWRWLNLAEWTKSFDVSWQS